MTNWSVWKHEKNYQKLFWAGVINGVGNRFSQVALLALLYKVTGSGAAIGFLFAVRLAPFLLLAPIGGMLADRYPKKTLLITIDLLRIPFVLSLLFVQGPEHLWIVYASSFCLAMGEAIYAPARMSSIPALVKPARLLYVNAIEQMMVGVVLVIGSSVGGGISYLFGMYVPFILNGLTFLLSALILFKLTIPGIERREKNTFEPPVQAAPVWKMIMGSSALVIFLVIALTMPLANGIDNVLMSMYALDVFGMGDLGVGFIYGALGIGLIASSFFSNMLKRGLMRLIIIFIALEGVGHILLSIVPTFSFAFLTVIFITFSGGIGNICLHTVIMKIVPKSMQGTFFGFTEMISNVALGLSMGFTGFLLELFAPRTLSLVVGIAYIIFTCMYALMFAKVNVVKEKRALVAKVRASV